MQLLADLFPTLARELSQNLRIAGHGSLADQVDTAAISKITFDIDADAGYIYIRPTHHLNAIEQNIIGVRFGQTLGVETPYWTNVDTDHFDRIVGIEILAPRDIKAALQKYKNG